MKEIYKPYALSSKNQKIILILYFIIWTFILPIPIALLLKAIGQANDPVFLFTNYFIGAMMFLYFGRDLLAKEREFSLTRSIVQIVSSMVFMFIINIIFGLLMSGLFSSQTSANQESIMKTQMAGPVLSFISVAILAPIVEEIVFRGVLFRMIREKKSFLFAALCSGFLFGAIHVFESLFSGNYIDLLYVLLYGAMGVVFARMYEKTGSIYPCIIFHGVYNAIAFLMSIS